MTKKENKNKSNKKMNKSTIISLLLSLGVSVSANEIDIPDNILKELPKELQDKNKLQKLFLLWQQIDELEQVKGHEESKKNIQNRKSLFSEVCLILGFKNKGLMNPELYLNKDSFTTEIGDLIFANKKSYTSKIVMFLFANRLKHLGLDPMMFSRCLLPPRYYYSRNSFNKLEIQIDALRELKNTKTITDKQINEKLLLLRKNSIDALHKAFIINLLDDKKDFNYSLSNLNLLNLLKMAKNIYPEELDKFKDIKHKIETLLKVLIK